MNSNVCEAARSGGAGIVIFSGSMLACTSGGPSTQVTTPSELPDLLFKGEMSCFCDEIYGLGKIIGEQTLRYCARQHGLSAIALRPPAFR